MGRATATSPRSAFHDPGWLPSDAALVAGLELGPGAALSEAVDAYLRRAVAGDRRGSLDVALDWAERFSPTAAIVDVLAPAQVETGWRWQTARWSVTDEHVVSGVTDFVLAVIADRYRVPEAGAGAVAVVCAQGEWHSLAARIVAELLRLEGRRVEMLGASTPAADLAAYLRDEPAVAVAVHCSVASNLPGLLRTIEAAHACGAPVVAGGRALTEMRAARLGADAFARDTVRLVSVLERWSRGRHGALRSPAGPDHEYFELEMGRSELVDVAMVAVMTGFPDLAAFDHEAIRMVRDDLDHMVRFVTASLLVDDRAIVTEAFVWLQSVYESRGLPGAIVTALGAGVLEALGGLDDAMPAARAALIDGAGIAPD